MSALQATSPAPLTPAGTDPNILAVNGLRFARAPRKRTGSPLDPMPDMDGWYKPIGKGVLLLAPDGGPMAYACSNGNGFLVTAHLWGGKVRYMHALTSRDEEALRITGYMHGIETARVILNHVYKEA